MKYEDENWIKIYTRDTAGWLSLSWQARGLMLEIARKLPKTTGELSLGRKGLEALAALLRAPWAELEPYIRELIDDGRLEYDPAAETIRDPQHAERQTAIASGSVRTQNWRDRKKATPPPANDVTPPVTDVTPRDVVRRDVTPRDGARRGVTERDQKKEEKEKKEEIPPTPQGGTGRAVDLGTALAMEVISTYEAAVSEATGRTFGLESGRAPRADLISAVNNHCDVRGADLVKAWVRRKAVEWVQPRRNEPELASNFSPRGFNGWLNGGSKPPLSARRATGTDHRRPEPDYSNDPSRRIIRDEDLT